MSETVQVLLVQAGGLAWALPMASVEQAFHLKDAEVANIGSGHAATALSALIGRPGLTLDVAPPKVAVDLLERLGVGA